MRQHLATPGPACVVEGHDVGDVTGEASGDGLGEQHPGVAPGLGEIDVADALLGQPRAEHLVGRVANSMRSWPRSDCRLVTAANGLYTVSITSPCSRPPTLEDLREALVVAYGTDFGAHSPRWISRFTDMTRQAASYRAGRVLLAGDAAHVHSPHGGQGLNTGVQDAVNLGWKLAQVVKGTSPESLLDTYHAERHPVGARVLRNTMAQVALTVADERHQALHDTMVELLSMDEPRKRIAAMISGLDIHYDLGAGHPLLGRRMPDLDLHTADGSTRVFALFHDGRPVLLNLGAPGAFDISPWSKRVRLVDARHDGVWKLPVIGETSAPTAVLIRPDGHLAWTGDLTEPTLPQALMTWFGAPTGA